MPASWGLQRQGRLWTTRKRHIPLLAWLWPYSSWRQPLGSYLSYELCCLIMATVRVLWTPHCCPNERTDVSMDTKSGIILQNYLMTELQAEVQLNKTSTDQSLCLLLGQGTTEGDQDLWLWGRKSSLAGRWQHRSLCPLPGQFHTLHQQPLKVFFYWAQYL